MTTATTPTTNAGYPVSLRTAGGLLHRADLLVVLHRAGVEGQPVVLGHVLRRDALHDLAHVHEVRAALDDRLGHLVDRVRRRLRGRDEDRRRLERMDVVRDPLPG